MELRTSQLLRPALLLVLAASLFVPAVPAQKPKAEEFTVVRCWSYDVEQAADIAVGASVFVARDGGVIESVSLTGTKEWSTELGGSIVSNVEVNGNSVFVVTAVADGGGAQLRSLSTETGVVKWSVPVAPAARYEIDELRGSLAVTGITSEVFEAATGKRSAVNVNDHPAATVTGDEIGNIIRTVNGRESWRYRTGGAISRVIELDDSAIVASDDNFVYAISLSGGRVRWKHRLAGRIVSLSRIGTDLLIASTFDEHSLTLLDIKKGRAVGRVTLRSDESAVAIRPLADASFIVLTDAALQRYSPDGCQK